MLKLKKNTPPCPPPFMSRVTVEIRGIDKLRNMARLLGPETVQKCTREGVKYASRAAITTAAKEIGGVYALKAARIKADIRGPFFSRGGDNAALLFNSRPPSAIAYGGKDTGTGLTMTVVRGKRVKVKDGFIPKSGKLAGKPFKRLGPSRYSKLKFVYGPSVGRIFAGRSIGGPRIRQQVDDRINEQFTKGFERTLDAKLRGFGK